jgi:hypothetical protein
VTVSCDAGLCPNAFHLSCANKNGLLQIRGELVRSHFLCNDIETDKLRLSLNKLDKMD